MDVAGRVKGVQGLRSKRHLGLRSKRHLDRLQAVPYSAITRVEVAADLRIGWHLRSTTKRLQVAHDLALRGNAFH